MLQLIWLHRDIWLYFHLSNLPFFKSKPEQKKKTEHNNKIIYYPIQIVAYSSILAIRNSVKKKKWKRRKVQF